MARSAAGDRGEEATRLAPTRRVVVGDEDSIS